MSRAAVLDALRASDALAEKVAVPANVIADPLGEGRPVVLSPGNFVVLRWGEQDWDSRVKRGPVNLTVWAHSPKEKTDSFNDINFILYTITDVLLGLEQIVGADGWRLTCIDAAGGWSEDIVDDGYNTIAKNAPFRVLTNYIPT
jgi:hypothetical protein